MPSPYLAGRVVWLHSCRVCVLRLLRLRIRLVSHRCAAHYRNDGGCPG
jgi:hypothetical protein